MWNDMAADTTQSECMLDLVLGPEMQLLEMKSMQCFREAALANDHFLVICV